MDITLGQEHGTIKHSFFCKLKPHTKMVKIVNAGESPYQKGWIGYAPFESKNGRTWIRGKPGRYNGKTFVFPVAKTARYACWFPSYPLAKMQKLCASFQSVGHDAFFLGDQNKPTIVLLAGQHPAETMGLYFLEGVLRSVLADRQFLKDFSILVFPYVNRDGMRCHNHRLMPAGVDLNRDWANPNNSRLCEIKDLVNRIKNIWAVIDIHGDEVAQKDYVIHNKHFKNSVLAHMCQRQGFVLIQRQSVWKKFLKNLVLRRKIIWPHGQTARDYFDQKHILAITLELSAATNTPESCVQKGMLFLH